MQEVITGLQPGQQVVRTLWCCKTRWSNKVIRARFVDFALENRFIIFAAAILLLFWGTISFHNFPSKLIPTWPTTTSSDHPVAGRSAEEVEQQVTIPIEIQMNGIPAPRAPAIGVLVRAIERLADFRRRSPSTTGTGRRPWNDCHKSSCPPALSHKWARTGVQSARFSGIP